ncbi:MAG TPA: hypothetical protein VFM12_03160 [Gemmatimonadales bacterium]|nr:hypothetical protein [Gemmatimonadales bacterium]
MKKQPLTLEQHREIGDKLKLIREYVTDLEIELTGSLPKSDRNVTAVRRMADDIESLRMRLEGIMSREHQPFEGMRRVYYGSPQ